jgi:hypothetical protein
MASAMPPPSLVSQNMISPQIDRRDTFLTKNMKEYDTNLSSSTKQLVMIAVWYQACFDRSTLIKEGPVLA